MQLRGVFSTRRLQASGFVKGLHRILTCSVFAVMQTFFALSDEQRTCHETSREVERSLSPLCDNHFVVIWAVRNSEVNLGFSRLCLPMTSDAMHVYTFIFACCRSKVSNIVWSSFGVPHTLRLVHQERMKTSNSHSTQLAMSAKPASWLMHATGPKVRFRDYVLRLNTACTTGMKMSCDAYYYEA